MLIRQDFLRKIENGEVDLAFRRWRRPTVKAGGTLRTAIGVLAIESIEEIASAAIDEASARRAGFGSRAELLRDLRPDPQGRIYRIALRRAGPDPRVKLRAKLSFSAEEARQIEQGVARLDAAVSQPWVRRLLLALQKNPGLRAAELAPRLGLEKEWLKIKIRPLKEFGLTESLPNGYRLSARGKAWLSRA